MVLRRRGNVKVRARSIGIQGLGRLGEGAAAEGGGVTIPVIAVGQGSSTRSISCWSEG